MHCGLIMGISYLVKINSKENEFLNQKTNASGYGRQSDGNRKIVPREEIEIKPNMSGIIDKILVKEGDKSYYGAIGTT